MQSITKPILPVAVVMPVMLIAFAVLIFLMLRRRGQILDLVFTAARLVAIFALAFMVNLRVQVARDEMNIQLKNLDVLFVVDTTISMWAQDYNGSNPRIDGVLADCEYIVTELTGSNFALIRFDNRAQVLAPFTQDATNVLDAFSTINAPDLNYARGSSLSAPYEEMQMLLESSEMKEGRKTFVFFISDGEITDGSQLPSYQALAPFLDGGAVLGYGTEAGGRMRVGQWSGYVQDPETGGDALSVIDEGNLRQLASDLSIDYIRMSGRGNVDYMLDLMRRMSGDTSGTTNTMIYEDTYQYYALPLVLLLLLELALFVRRGRL